MFLREIYNSFFNFIICYEFNDKYCVNVYLSFLVFIIIYIKYIDYIDSIEYIE